MKIVLRLIPAMLIAGFAVASAAAEPRLVLSPSADAPRLDRSRLLGSNIALWYEEEDLGDATVRDSLRNLNPGILRMPGGSWSDEIYWNGNGVRTGDQFDSSQRTGHSWTVDYSDYAPGFRLANVQGDLSDYHGVQDVESLHNYIQKLGAETIVTVNAGSGTPQMAAEWVRWANLKKGYKVRYWEVGNELEGRWEIGNRKVDGSLLTGEEYAHRFQEFAKAMKQVDPTIKVGGPTASNLEGGFLEETLRIAGDHVDFVSIHTYPVGGGVGGDQKFFAAIDQLSDALARYRSLIRRYQPARADQIEIGITEWNSKVLEDRDTGDLINGLWTAAFIGELFEHGVSFAAQWDMLTRTEEGGHGFFAKSQEGWVPTAQFWAMQIWRHHMGDRWIPSRIEGASPLRSMVTASGDRLHVMLLNLSRDEVAEVVLEDPSFRDLSSLGRQVTLSHNEYFWDAIQHEPRWSSAPVPEPVTLTENGALQVPPFSLRVFEIPMTGSPERLSSSAASRDETGLQIHLPDEAPGDLPIEGWLLTGKGGLNDDVELSVDGPGTLDRTTVSVTERAGRFFIQPTGAGELTIHARINGSQTSRTIIIQEVVERDEVIWRFESEVTEWKAESSFALRRNGEVKPNQSVAEIEFRGERPDQGMDIAASFEVSGNVERDRIRGVVFEAWVPPGMSRTDETLGLGVILQSEGAHWINLGSVPLTQLEPGWQHIRLPLPDAELAKVVGNTYALRFQLFQQSKNKTPVTGSLYLDNVGFILR